MATENGKTFWVNPSQKNTKECVDVAPDDRYTCEQQVCTNNAICGSELEA